MWQAAVEEVGHACQANRFSSSFTYLTCRSHSSWHICNPPLIPLLAVPCCGIVCCIGTLSHRLASSFPTVLCVEALAGCLDAAELNTTVLTGNTCTRESHASTSSVHRHTHLIFSLQYIPVYTCWRIQDQRPWIMKLWKSLTFSSQNYMFCFCFSPEESQVTSFYFDHGCKRGSTE